MQEGNPTCCESPASLKGGSHNAGTLKRDSETRGENPQEAAQRHGEHRTDRIGFRARGSGQRSHRTARHGASRTGEAGSEMLGDGAVLLLLLLPWTAQGRAVSEAGGPAWARGQQLSQQLCVLAWSAHLPMGHVVSGSSRAHLSSPRLQWKRRGLGWKLEGWKPSAVGENSG